MTSYRTKRRVTFIHTGRTFDFMLRTMGLNTPEFADMLEIDDDSPEYVIATEKCFVNGRMNRLLRQYMDNRRNCIFIFFSLECIEPDMNIFDYAATWNRNHVFPGRIIHNIPLIYDYRNNSLSRNTLTREEAAKTLRERQGFCNFIYSHAYPVRDKFFRMLSEYKKVDSLGAHMNNTGTESTRNAKDWYGLSIGLKENYKFSIAMENASYSGYTSEKIISSLIAHTVPVYWGDPDVSEFINPKAFINCNEYSSFDGAVERIKAIDSDNEQWLDMVTQAWCTEEQEQKVISCVEDYRNFFRKIFTADINEARKRPEGAHPDIYFNDFWRLGGNFPLAFKVKRELNRIIRKICRQPS